MVKIVGIGGSLRTESSSYQALAVAIQRVQALGASTEIIDLRQMQLPFVSVVMTIQATLMSSACAKQY